MLSTPRGKSPAGTSQPVEDGACRHLRGLRLPAIGLASTDGSSVDLSALPGRVVLYIYPRTGRPDEPPSKEWDRIPGARGCTVQSYAFRDQFAELRALRVTAVFGLSTQHTAYQREMVARLRLPFPILSDARLRLATALQLPTFTTSDMTLLKRVTLIIDDAVIRHVFYPVFPPERNADEVLAWLGSDAAEHCGAG